MTEAIAATLHSYKSLATRKQLQITLEVPAEYAAKALKMLGVGDPSGSQWFALTRLKEIPGSSNGRTPDFDSGNGGSSPSPGTKTRSNRAAVMVKENQDFKNWLVDTYWTGKEEIGDYDGLLKRALGIVSKKELDVDGPAADRWEQMLTSFTYRNQVRA